MSKELENKYLERDLLLTMIVSTEFLTYIREPLNLAFKQYQKNEFIRSKEIELIMRWVLQYFDSYGKAPLHDMQDLVESKSARLRLTEPNLADLIEALVETLSLEWENKDEREINAQAKWDIAREYFALRRADILSRELEIGVDNLDTEFIDEALQRHSKTESSSSKITDFLNDEGLTKRAHEQRAEPLIKFPGAFGQMVNRHMIPGGFVSFLGSEKRGKSWTLLYTQMMATRNRIPTLMLQCGDMSDEDVDIRTGIHLTRRSNDKAYCGRLFVPVYDCAKNQDGSCAGKGLVWPGKDNGGDSESEPKSKGKKQSNGKGVTSLADIEWLLKENKGYEPCQECRRDETKNRDYKGAVYWTIREPVEPLTWQEHFRAKQEFIQTHRLNETTTPLMVNYAADELTVSEIRSILERLKNAGRMPRILIIDYMDLIRAEKYTNDFRNAQYDIWKAMRGLAKEYGILIVTATQANAASYVSDLLDESNFSEDKRKNGLVTALFGLNQTPREKEQGVMRINTILAREGYFDKRKTVSVLQCLQMGQPILGSYWT